MNHYGDHLHHEFHAKMGNCYRGDLKNQTHIQEQGWVHQSSLSDLKSESGRISSDLTGFANEFSTKFFKIGLKSDPKPTKFD